MNFYTRHVKPLGFKGSGIFTDSKWYSTYYLVNPELRLVIILQNLSQALSVYRLNACDFKRFREGKLSLIPPGCCNPSGGPSRTNAIVFHEGEIKNVAHLRELVGKITESAQ